MDRYGRKYIRESLNNNSTLENLDLCDNKIGNIYDSIFKIY